MNYLLSLFTLLFCLTDATAGQSTLTEKSFKVQFLVIGATTAGIGAGIQAAKCGIKTLIIDSTTTLGTDVDELDSTFTLGLDGRYFNDRRLGKSSQEIFKLWLNEYKDLKVLMGVAVVSAVKGVTGWQLKLSNGQAILADWVFEDKGSQIVEYNPDKFMKNFDISTTYDNWPGNQYRTQLGTPRGENKMTAYPMARFLKTKKENWIVIPAVRKSISIGQIVGAIVANPLNNSAKDFDVRAVQKLLLEEGLYFDTFNDLKIEDPHFLMFQRIFATGLLKPMYYMPGGLNADPEDVVNINHMSPVFSDYYPSSVLWFEKHPMGKLTISEALELIFTISKRNLDVQIELEWNRKLRFTSIFNPERHITRREFGMLLDTYLDPFDMKVNVSGNIIRND